MIAHLVYMLCGLTSAACAVLLFRSYRRNRTQLALGTGLCFALLGLSNILLFVDFVILPEFDFSVIRSSLTAAGLLLLVYGLISKST